MLQIGGYVTQYCGNCGLGQMATRSAGTSLMQAVFFFGNWLYGNLNAPTVVPDNLASSPPLGTTLITLI